MRNLYGVCSELLSHMIFPSYDTYDDTFPSFVSYDLGEYTLNPMYTKLIIENNLIQNKTKIGTNKNKPNIKRTIRLAAEKANIAIRNHSNF